MSSRYSRIHPMNMIIKYTLVICFIGSALALSFTSQAAGAKVEAMQMPAWFERAGTRLALKPGMELNSGDVLTTGAGARMLLRMDEGSEVKMGEHASLDLTTMLPAQTEQDYFEAAINVIKGAFRFTTTALGTTRKRNIDIRIGSVSAGIRGTDIWGSATDDKDILCLIEGKISAQREGEPAFTMNDPLSFYIAPKSKPALPIKPVPQDQLTKWAAETEVQPGAGVLSVNGIWAVNLMSLDSAAAADPVVTLLSNAGYATDIHKFQWHNRDWYRVRITGFKTRADAQTFVGLIDGKFGIVKPWVVQF